MFLPFESEVERPGVPAGVPDLNGLNATCPEQQQQRVRFSG